MTQRTKLPHLCQLQVEQIHDRVILDAATLHHLEILQNPRGGTENTLADVLDHSATPMGSRLLKRWLLQPLRQKTVIEERHAAVSMLMTPPLALDLHHCLKTIGDIERIVTRIALKSARPRDLLKLKEALLALPEFQKILSPLTDASLQQLCLHLQERPELSSLLQQAIIDEAPILIRDGGVIKQGYDPELDELRNLRDNANQFLMDLEAREKAQTGLSNLKVGYNKIHGYFIELSRQQASLAPNHYIRRQTLKNAERFLTPELKAFEEKVLSANAKALAREKYLYDQLLETLIEHLHSLQKMAQALAELDVLTTFAERAQALHLVKPNLVDDATITIEEGRHLVIEEASTNPFVPNDLHLDPTQKMLIITGPNMGGKSTYMRQTALITLLSYTGCFVPARSATLGPIDRIFTRIGAFDDLASGRSTFMVEMTETANILHYATKHSLVLLDEIGRGTSTYDGLALAFACATRLAQHNKAFTLFATHYFELTELANQLPHIANIHLDATEHQDNLVFLHKVQKGPANKSYGIQVAKLAGLPAAVIQIAHQKLLELEHHRTHGTKPLPVKIITEDHPVVSLLQTLEPDELSPKQAMDYLYQLKQLVSTIDEPL